LIREYIHIHEINSVNMNMNKITTETCEYEYKSALIFIFIFIGEPYSFHVSPSLASHEVLLLLEDSSSSFIASPVMSIGGSGLIYVAAHVAVDSAAGRKGSSVSPCAKIQAMACPQGMPLA
jgi:hypothetical protein